MIRILFCLIGLVICSNQFSVSCAADNRSEEDASEQIMRLTTLVDVQFDDGTRSVGSGFYFHNLAPADDSKSGPQWVAIKETYLITNRHAVPPGRYDHIEKLIFYLRRATQDGAEWLPVEIPKRDLGRRLHFHPKKEVDVAAISVLDLLTKAITPGLINSSGEGTSNVIAWNAVTRDDFPGISRLKVSTGDDLLVVGYPRMVYDHYNKLPILKGAKLITPWKTHFEGWDAFLIDAKLFEGSSGSIVITRPTDLLFENGRWYKNDYRKFLFLGVYSGEPAYELKAKKPASDPSAPNEQNVVVDLGVVWYFYTVEETISAPAFRLNK